jgi:mannose-6-phosphate isomerase
MAADESAEIIVGFNQELDKDVYLQKLEEGKILEVMNATKTSSGDVFHIPTGRVHAIGAGVLLAEIQQTSDITYRIYDYNRIDKKTGKTRDLHNELAIDVIDFKVQESYKTKYTNTPNQRNTMVHTPYFKTNIINLNKTKALDYSKTDSFIIHMCTNGKYSLEYQKEEYILQKGECIVIPAAIDHIIAEPKNTCEFLEVYL